MPVISGRCSVLTSAPAVVQLFPLRDEINDFTTDGAGVVSCLQLSIVVSASEEMAHNDGLQG